MGLSLKVVIHKLRYLVQDFQWLMVINPRCRGDWQRALARVALTTKFQSGSSD